MSSETDKQKHSEDGPAAEATRGILFVVSSPSGGGKGTIVSRVLKTVPNLGYSVSFTTRPPRAGEREGFDYYFISPEKFNEMRSAGGFLECAVVHGNLYGTGREEVWGKLREGGDILLEIDVQGAESVRETEPTAVSIFILPPSFEILRARLTGRGSEHPGDVELRLNNACREVLHYTKFDYIVINDEAERAATQVASIIYAERARRTRQEEVVRRVLDSFPPAPATA
jgi:guanylate kinase